MWNMLNRPITDFVKQKAIDIANRYLKDSNGKWDPKGAFDRAMADLKNFFTNYVKDMAYGRGVGKPISACPSDKEKDGALCYPKCRSGYHGVGPVCWQSCGGFGRDDGAFCAKPSSTVVERDALCTGCTGCSKCSWRGCSGCSGCSDCSTKRCRSNEQGHGALCYPKCRSGYHNVACCTCSPNCPSGMKDNKVVSCTKKSYGRSAGSPLVCASNVPDKDAGPCYANCKSGYTGVGPVCWRKQQRRSWGGAYSETTITEKQIYN